MMNNPVGLEPVTIISVSWGAEVDPTGKVVNLDGQVVSYADKDITDPQHPDTVIIPGKIMSMSDLDEVIKIDTGSTSASVSVVLSDTDGSLKALYDVWDLHKRPVIIYQHFDGLDPTIYPFVDFSPNQPPTTDPFEIFRGEIASPVIWSEGERTLSFDIISKVYALEAGFAPEQGQFNYVPLDLIGKVWPMVFGTPIHVPATKFQHVRTGTILTTFGVPDATLQYKYNLMTFIRDDLVASFNHYYNLIQIAEDIEVPAYQLQDEYAHHIVNHDGMKQAVEDLHDQIENYNRQIITLIGQYNDEDDNSASDSRASILSQLQPLRDERAKLMKAYKDFIVQNENMEAEAKGFKLRLKNAKFEVTVINKLRKKCKAVLGDYYTANKQILQLYNALQNQSYLTTNSTAIMVGPDFPQNAISTYTINNLEVQGKLKGYSLSEVVPQPRYYRLEVGERGGDGEDPELAKDVTAFWLADNQPLLNPTNTIPDLTGMFLWLGGKPPDVTQTPPKIDPIDGRIVRVTQQVGRQVNVQLVKKVRNPRIQKQKINYVDDQKIKESFEATLERLLTGNETDEQINAIANTIPRDLSPKIWDILTGGDNVIYLELENVESYEDLGIDVAPMIDPDVSCFTLVYNNEELTDPIYFTDSAGAIEQKILNSTLSLDGNDVTVTIEKSWDTAGGGGNANLWRLLKIQYNGLMRPLTLDNIKIVNLFTTINPGKLTIRKVTTEPTGFYIRFTRDCVVDPYALFFVGEFDPQGPNGPQDPTNEDGYFNLQLNDYEEPLIALYFMGYKVEFNPVFEMPDSVIKMIEDLDPAFKGLLTIDGAGPLLNYDWTITCNDGFSSLFIDTTGVDFRAIDTKATDITEIGFKLITNSMLKNRFRRPNLSVETFGGGAHEYTKNQRQTKLQNMVKKNANAPGIEKNRNKIRDLLKAMKESAESDGADAGAREAVFNAMSAYREMAKSVDQSTFNNDDAYKLISDAEYALLYDMEVAGYTEWVNSFTDIDADLTDDIDYEFTMVDVQYIKEACSIILPRWTQRLKLDDQYTDEERIKNGDLTSDQVLYETHLLPNSTSAWLGNVGDTIGLSGSLQEWYVCSILPGTIKAVYAVKQVAGINRLIPVPSRYYVKIDMGGDGFNPKADPQPDSNTYINCVQLKNNLKFFADFGIYHGVTVTLTRPLTEIDPSWSDQLYVTLESCVGPNVCDAIAWIVATYTNLTLDLTSFQHVHGLLANYPANFAMLDKQNVIELCEQLAWQSRCTLWVKEGKMYIRYLPEIPTPYKTITKDDIQQASLQLSYTPTEELITKLTATWRATYAQTTDYSLIIRRNLTRYNEVADSREIYIYNSKDLVWKTATWWAIRKGTTWRLLKCKLFMNNIDLETQDCVLIDLTTYIYDSHGNLTGTIPDQTISNQPTLAIITKATFNSVDFSVDVDMWLPIVAGSKDQYQFAWPMGLNIQAAWPLPSDLAGGDAGSFNVVNGGEVSSTLGGGGGSPSLPIDIGRPDVGDAFDSMPADPSEPFTEIDYTEVDASPITIEPNLTSDLDDDGVQHSLPDIPFGPEHVDRDVRGINSECIAKALIVEQVTQYKYYDDDTVAGGVVKDYTYGDLYLIKPIQTHLNSHKSGNILAFGRNIDTSKTLAKNTEVLYGIFNGRNVFEYTSPLQPALDVDPNGDSLMDGPIDPNNPDTWSFF